MKSNTYTEAAFVRHSSQASGETSDVKHTCLYPAKVNHEQYSAISVQQIPRTIEIDQDKTNTPKLV